MFSGSMLYGLWGQTRRCRDCGREFMVFPSLTQSERCDTCQARATQRCDWCNGSGEGWDWNAWKVLPGGCTRCEGSGVRRQSLN